MTHSGRPHTTYGLSPTRFPERLFGADVEISWTPSAFTGHDLVESSRFERWQTTVGATVRF